MDPYFTLLAANVAVNCNNALETGIVRYCIPNKIYCDNDFVSLIQTRKKGFKVKNIKIPLWHFYGVSEHLKGCTNNISIRSAKNIYIQGIFSNNTWNETVQMWHILVVSVIYSETFLYYTRCEFEIEGHWNAAKLYVCTYIIVCLNSQSFTFHIFLILHLVMNYHVLYVK